MTDNENIISLIAKQLQGIATPQEAEAVRQWLHADAAHHQEYDELALIWQKSGPLLANPHFDANIAWLKLDNQIALSRNKPRMYYDTIISLLFTTRKIAVAIVLVSVAALAAYWWSQHTGSQTVIAGNQNQMLTLPDHSVVLLRKGSTLTYPKQFNKNERLVALTGEAFFQVQHNEHQPFCITTAHTEVKVLGTSFLVHSGKTEDEVIVVTGKVNVKDKHVAGNEVILTPGQRVVLLQDHFYQNSVTDSNFLAWKTGLLNFKQAPLQKVLQDIAHYYETPVEMAPGTEIALQPITVTVQFDNQPFDQALEEIKLITGLNMKKAKDKIIFYRK